MCIRCKWVNVKSEVYVQYHDEEWGVPVHNDTLLFEMLTLEGAQAGLSWEIILKRREGYRKAFDAYDIDKISKYTNRKIHALMTNQGIIKNKLKIESVIKNAKVFRKIQDEFGSFDSYLWSFVGHKQIQNKRRTIKDIPAKTELSDRLSKDLKRRGMSFVGSTILYAFMQATGLVNDHTVDCYRYKEIMKNSSLQLAK
jgi:DNA-3-methyladenine glycosylase I